ncbi:J domain-containing protein [Caminibacter pacificus]
MEIPPLSTMKDINRKYKNLAKKFHTDVGGDSEKIKEINMAYEILKDYIMNFRFTFSEDEILRQYPDEFLKKFKV